jgi:dienelactone hydrolase
MRHLARLAAPALLAATLLAPGHAGAQPLTDSFDMLLAPPQGRAQRIALMLVTPMPHRALPAVIIVPDEAGLDGRTARLADVALGRGWVSIEVDPEPLSLDGAAVPPPPTPLRLGRLLRELHEALQADERIDPRRIAVIGLGPAGRAAIHAAFGDGRPGFAAHAGLYPDCAALAAEQEVPPEAPALLLLPGAEEPAGACAGLGARVQRLEGATYGWDHLMAGTMHRWTAGGSTPVHPDGPTTEAAESALTAFLAEAFSRVR